MKISDLIKKTKKARDLVIRQKFGLAQLETMEGGIMADHRDYSVSQIAACCPDQQFTFSFYDDELAVLHHLPKNADVSFYASTDHTNMLMKDKGYITESLIARVTIHKTDGVTLKCKPIDVLIKSVTMNADSPARYIAQV